MKLFGLILLLVVATCNGTSHVGLGLQFLIENLRDTIKHGKPQSGFPVCDPLELDTYNFDIDNGSVEAAGTLTDLKVNGLTRFIIKSLSYSDEDVRFTYCINWPSIKITADYKIRGTIANFLSISSSSDFRIWLTNWKICGDLTLSEHELGGRTRAVYVRTSNAALTPGRFTVAIINSKVPQILRDSKSRVNKAVNDAIIKAGTKLFGTCESLDFIRFYASQLTD